MSNSNNDKMYSDVLDSLAYRYNIFGDNPNGSLDSLRQQVIDQQRDEYAREYARAGIKEPYQPPTITVAPEDQEYADYLGEYYRVKRGFQAYSPEDQARMQAHEDAYAAGIAPDSEAGKEWVEQRAAEIGPISNFEPNEHDVNAALYREKALSIEMDAWAEAHKIAEAAGLEPGSEEYNEFSEQKAMQIINNNPDYAKYKNYEETEGKAKQSDKLRENWLAIFQNLMKNYH